MDNTAVSQGATLLLQFVQSAGVIGILIVFVVLFYRGEILPRKVWDKMTRQVVDGICTRYEAATQKMVADIVEQVSEVQCRTCSMKQEE